MGSFRGSLKGSFEASVQVFWACSGGLGLRAESAEALKVAECCGLRAWGAWGLGLLREVSQALGVPWPLSDQQARDMVLYELRHLVHMELKLNGHTMAPVNRLCLRLCIAWARQAC